MRINSIVVLLVGIILFFVIQAVRCSIAVKKKRNTLKDMERNIIRLSYGDMSYIDKGEGESILSVHGIFGGYDQAYDTCKDFSYDFRIIAPSRFGYLGSDVYGDGTPSEQVEAYVELLDRLGIDKTYVLATSAGGSVAIRFALDYPEKTKGLILFCSSMPLIESPEKVPAYAGPPSFLLNDFAMFVISPLFEPVMGMKSSTINEMFPVNERKKGVVIDSKTTNLDMMRNYDLYDVEKLKCPTLIIHAKDDKLAKYEYAQKAAARFPDCKLVSFETGGHLIEGHSEEVKKILSEFIEFNKTS